jgi:hypothetical protein
MKIKCHICDGAGYGIVGNFETRSCDTCNGAGVVERPAELVYADEPWTGNLADPARAFDLNLRLQ